MSRRTRSRSRSRSRSRRQGGAHKTRFGKHRSMRHKSYRKSLKRPTIREHGFRIVSHIPATRRGKPQSMQVTPTMVYHAVENMIEPVNHQEVSMRNAPSRRSLPRRAARAHAESLSAAAAAASQARSNAARAGRAHSRHMNELDDIFGQMNLGK